MGSIPAPGTKFFRKHVATPVGIEIAVGIGVSLWAATLIRSLLYGLEPSDPATLTGAVAVLATVATIAGWLPAWRASRIGPAKVMRESQVVQNAGGHCRSRIDSAVRVHAECWPHSSRRLPCYSP